jgi:hypothetical protein
VKAALLAGGTVAAAALLIALWPNPPPPERPIQHREDRYIPPPPEASPLPPIRFVEVGLSAGLEHLHATGAFQFDDGGPSRYLPECMGPGVILFDADQDGRDDVFVTNGCAFPGRPEADPRPTWRFFRNEGGLRFTDQTTEAGLDVTAYGMGGAAADVDGDGDPDLLVTTWGGLRCFRNRLETGRLRFEEATAEAGLLTEGWTDDRGRRGPDWATAAAFFDADGDGDLDLFVANYACWSPEADVFATVDGVNKSFTIPDRYDGSTCRYFENTGSGRFQERTREAGVHSTKAKALGIALWDMDDNGFLDVIVANDQEPNLLYLNHGGRFEEAGVRYGIAYDENARTRAGMGIDAGDFLNDGLVAVPIGNFSNEPVALYVREELALFRDLTSKARVAAVTQLPLTFGCLLVDADLDGFLDLALANGHLEPEIQRVQRQVAYRQRPMLLRNQGDGTFRDWTDAAGPAFAEAFVGRALAASDLDGDGDPDLVFTDNAGGIRLFRNDGPRVEEPLRIRLRGRPPNREAIGARVRVTTPGRTQTRLVRTGSSYLAQSSLEILVAGGPIDGTIQVEVRWPLGRTLRRELAPGAERVLVLEE